MSKGKRRRRPGGHPAKVAARRVHEQAKRERVDVVPDHVVRKLLEEARTLSGPLEAELWASELLGTFWGERQDLDIADAYTDYSMGFAHQLIEKLARWPGEGPVTVLMAIAAVDGDVIGEHALELARELAERGELAPEWIYELGKAEITGGAVLREDVWDDAVTVFLEARHPSGDRHAVGVLIDNNLGMLAREIGVGDSLSGLERSLRENPDIDREVITLETIHPGRARAWIEHAMAVTDETLAPQVAEDYVNLRAFALLRCAAAPEGFDPPHQREWTSTDRDKLLGEFLSSPEGKRFASGGTEASVASTAISFAADYVDSRPLRWSPTLVEMFMTVWVPHRVGDNPELLEALPDAFEAWVEFAGRRSKVPERYLQMTLAEIPVWREKMIERSKDPNLTE